MSGRNLVPIVVAVASLALLSAPVAAGTRCRSSAVTVGALTQDQAIAGWRKKVKNQIGTAWSNFSLARNKNFSQQNLGVSTLNFVTATPCRRY